MTRSVGDASGGGHPQLLHEKGAEHLDVGALLGQQPQGPAVDALAHLPGQVPAVPAVAQHDGDLVLAGGQGGGDVVGLDQEVVGVLGLARGGDVLDGQIADHRQAWQ